MPWTAGDEFVSCNLEHPALATPAGVLEQRFGATVKRVELSPTASAGEIIESFAGAITPATKLVALSHVQYSCGLKLPIKQIAEIAHRNGTLIMVDGAQTGGQLDIDVKALDVDFYSISRPEVAARSKRHRRLLREEGACARHRAPVLNPPAGRRTRRPRRAGRGAASAALPHRLADRRPSLPASRAPLASCARSASQTSKRARLSWRSA